MIFKVKENIPKLEKKIKYELGHYLSEIELKALIQKIKFAGHTIENNIFKSLSYMIRIEDYIKTNSKLPQKVVIPIIDYINEIEKDYKKIIKNYFEKEKNDTRL